LDLSAANDTCPDKSDTRGEYEPEQETGHRDAPETRKPRASLTGYAAEVSVVRVGSAPLASIGPVAVKEIRQTTIASIR
jgi:hypothetical protein